MATDIALDVATGDLTTEPNNDIALVTGSAVTDQRIRIRLKAQAGDWVNALDMAEGDMAIGSRLYEMARLPIDMAFTQIPLVVKEALAPMTDISVVDVVCQLDDDSPTKINFTVYYTVLDDDGESEGDVQTIDDSVLLTPGVN